MFVDGHPHFGARETSEGQSFSSSRPHHHRSFRRPKGSLLNGRGSLVARAGVQPATFALGERFCPCKSMLLPAVRCCKYPCIYWRFVDTSRCDALHRTAGIDEQKYPKSIPIRDMLFWRRRPSPFVPEVPRCPGPQLVCALPYRRKARQEVLRFRPSGRNRVRREGSNAETFGRGPHSKVRQRRP